LTTEYIDFGIPWGECDMPVYGEFEDRFRHLYVLGKTRSGKSTLFLNLIKQHLDYGVIVVDPAGNVARDIASMVEDKDRVVYVDVENPLPINPLIRYGDKWGIAYQEIKNIIDNSVTYTTATEKFTVLMRELLRNTIRILTNRGTGQKNLKYIYRTRSKVLAGGDDDYWFSLSYMFKDPHTGKMKVDQQKFQEFKEKRDSARRAATRMSEFFETPSMEQFVRGNDQFNPKEIAEQRKIVCFNLHGFSHDEMIFLGNLITNAIKTYYQNFAVMGGAELFVFIDEFHLFMSPVFGQMLVECGKYNISLNLSHHSHSQIKNQEVLDTAMECHTKIVFSSGYNEAFRMCKEYRRDIDDFMKLGKYEAMLQIGTDVCHIKTYPPPETEPYIPEKFWYYESQRIPLMDCVKDEPIDNLFGVE